MTTQIHESKNLGDTRDRSERAPATLSTMELMHACSEEMGRYLNGRSRDDRYGLEVFRRALVLRDEGAWSALYQLYAPLVLSWVRTVLNNRSLLNEQDAASLVNAAFAKFDQAYTPTKMECFPTLSMVLKYLKRCVHSVVLDEVRTKRHLVQSREVCLLLDEHDRASSRFDAGDPDEGVVSQVFAQELWECIARELHSEQERIVVALVCVHGVKPTEVAARDPILFPTVEDVYRVKRNVLARLQHNRHILAFARV